MVQKWKGLIDIIVKLNLKVPYNRLYYHTELKHPGNPLGSRSKKPITWIYLRFTRLLLVNRVLILTALSGTVLCHHFTDNDNLKTITETPELIFNTLAFLIGKTIPVFAVLDARSRYQDYKKAKDLFFKNGFKPRIANLFIHSRCQREAVLVAARDLGLTPLLSRYYLKKGYRWYHILPNFTFKRPGIFFTIKYWKRTLFASSYKSVYFL